MQLDVLISGYSITRDRQKASFDVGILVTPYEKPSVHCCSFIIVIIIIVFVVTVVIVIGVPVSIQGSTQHEICVVKSPE